MALRPVAALIWLLVFVAGTAEAAESMGLPNEQALVVTGKVVDMLSALTGAKAKNCGDGKRQLGIETSDGRLLLVAKDIGQFTGAVPDLLPYCSKIVTLDGLLTSNFDVTFYVVQTVRANGGKPVCANRTDQEWAKAHGIKLKDPCAQPDWYRNDETVAKIIAEQGKLGIGK